VALHCLDRVHVAAAEHVLILGFGAIGAATALVATVLGAIPLVVEASTERLRAASRLGFDTLAADGDLPRQVRRSVGGGGADVVVDATGSAEVLGTAVECATRGGRIVLVGLPASKSDLAIERLVLFERSLVGSLGYRNDLPRVLSLVETGRLDPGLLVETVIPLEAAPGKFSELVGSDCAAIKVLVDPNA
jgi:(R,R)-butanediol dehydrogenase/meso-butanediol dehydrogenase/diacetyl reductase